MMPVLTAIILATFLGYIGAWYTGALEGNFALLLFLATLVTGVYWLAERFYFLPKRQKELADQIAQKQDRQASLAKMGIHQNNSLESEASPEMREQILRQPWWLDWTAGLFPVIVVVFLLRSFLFEPFKIPSGSMYPTLWVGDLILVNKFHYGVRLPVINTKLTDGATVQRGDVMVFRYPPKPSLDYIKRVVGIPGDEVAYLNKKLTINGKPLVKESQPDFFEQDSMRYIKQFQEKTGDKIHNILNDDERPAFVTGADDFAFKQNCTYTVEGVTCKVPQGMYFMMGDNRDNSLDSRYWGFVPDKNIVGKAFFVWMNFGHISRIGSFD